MGDQTELLLNTLIDLYRTRVNDDMVLELESIKQHYLTGDVTTMDVALELDELYTATWDDTEVCNRD